MSRVIFWVTALIFFLHARSSRGFNLGLPVDELSSDAPLEEAAATVAGQNTVVLPGTGVPADDAD